PVVAVIVLDDRECCTLPLPDALPILLRIRQSITELRLLNTIRAPLKVFTRGSRRRSVIVMGSESRADRRHSGPGRAERKRHSARSEEHTSELQSRENLVCRLLLAKKN